MLSKSWERTEKEAFSWKGGLRRKDWKRSVLEESGSYVWRNCDWLEEKTIETFNQRSDVIRLCLQGSHWTWKMDRRGEVWAEEDQLEGCHKPAGKK